MKVHRSDNWAGGIGQQVENNSRKCFFPLAVSSLKENISTILLQYQHVLFSFLSEGGSWTIRLHMYNFSVCLAFFTVFTKNIIYMLICSAITIN